jgi:hypothetical protein
MSWINKLKSRWSVGSAWQVVVILLVFACTGFTVFFLKRPLFAYLFNGAPRPIWASVFDYILVLPFYNVLLLLYGFIFGQFRFFWDFEKKFLIRLWSIFKKK